MPTSTWRGLGRSGDLDLRLDGDPAEATTRLLATCAVDPRAGDPEAARSLTLSGRIGGLAAVLLRSQTDAVLPVPLRCPEEACAEAFEAVLPLDTIRALGLEAEADPVIPATVAGRAVRLRRPTGLDLLRWRDAGWTDPAEAEREVARSLLLDDDDAVLDLDGEAGSLGARMEEVDPLPAFRVSTRCPACDAPVERDLDLEALLLGRLAACQRQTLRDVHRLASRYGWSEADVLAVPPARRAAYLSLIDEEAAW